MSKFLQQSPLILASSSIIRNKLLSTLGLNYLTIPSHCDEELIKQRFHSEDKLELGYQLARAKALAVSVLHPDHFVIAADQLCLLDNQLLDKPLTHVKAVQQLSALSGRQHQQIACLCIAKESQIIWQHHEIAYLTLSNLSDETIEAYLQEEKPYHSCGSYQYETQGKWLFDTVQGDEDTILGLPLFALTKALRQLAIVSF